jgi:hypothetical protein
MIIHDNDGDDDDDDDTVTYYNLSQRSQTTAIPFKRRALQ